MEIVLTVCAIVAASQCEERHISLDPDARLTAATCMMQSMPLIAQWAGENPKWVVKRWRCADPSRREWPV